MISTNSIEGNDTITIFLIKRNSDEDENHHSSRCYGLPHMYQHQPFSSNDFKCTATQSINILWFPNCKQILKYQDKSAAIIQSVIAAFTTTGCQRPRGLLTVLQHRHRCRYSQSEKNLPLCLCSFFVCERLAYKTILSKVLCNETWTTLANFSKESFLR